MRSGRRGWPLAAVLIAACSASHSASQTTPPPGTALLADQATVNGTISSAHIVNAVGPPLSLPLTITIPVRGHGGLHLQGVGESIAWDGGQPLPLSGTGTIDLGPATLDVDGGGLTWHLDGSPRLLTPGRYVAGSSVAVGTSGLAQPEDQAAFTIKPGTTGAMVTDGDAQVHLPAEAITLQGPGNVTLVGNMIVATAPARTTVRSVRFGSGAFDLHLTPSGGSWQVSGLLQGPISTA